MHNSPSIIHAHNSETCQHCAALASMQQALLSFTGVIIKESSDPVSKKAANQLYKNVKRVRIQGELER